MMGEIFKSSRTLLESIPATFLLTDVHSQILYANQRTEAFFGYAPDAMEGQRLRILFLQEDWIYFLPNIIFLARYKQGFDGEALLRQKDGKRIFVHLFASSFQEKGEVFLSFAFQEIHRLKNLEQERAEAERCAGMSRMVEEIAHQFRNPIASIGGYSKRLLREDSFSRQGRSYAGRILQETERLEAILQRVEEYVQIPQPVSKRENIEEVVGAVLEKFSQAALDKGIVLRCNNERLAGDGDLFIDRGLTARVLSHLLQNSLEAIALNPKRKEEVVEVILADDSDGVEVAVTDRGPGISQKNLGLIFDPFFSTQPDRVGLGLTFVRRAVEEQGGNIEVQSRLGKGTKVILHFPKDRRRKIRREWLSPEAAAREHN
jgi:PAS domain S-box-containing protein